MSTQLCYSRENFRDATLDVDTFTGRASSVGVELQDEHGWSEFSPSCWRAVVARQPRVVLCAHHQQDEPIGTARLWTDSDGNLMANASVSTGTQRGREALALVKLGAVNGLSVRALPLKTRFVQRGSRHVRVIEDARLQEVSVVTLPRDPAARITLADPALELVAGLSSPGLCWFERAAQPAALAAEDRARDFRDFMRARSKD